MNQRIAILSLSASRRSVGRICAHALAALLKERHHADVIDLQSLPPVWVDDRGLEFLPEEYNAIKTALAAADGVVLVCPIYGYAVSSPTKAITELFSSGLERMPVAMVVTAGSVRSHLAIGSLIQGMMFEQETLCYPKIVLTTGADLENESPTSELTGRLRELAEDFPRFTAALSTYRHRPMATAAH